jgi:hypothetical protein
VQPSGYAFAFASEKRDDILQLPDPVRDSSGHRWRRVSDAGVKPFDHG